jgi:hypothetical protein
MCPVVNECKDTHHIESGKIANILGGGIMDDFE